MKTDKPDELHETTARLGTERLSKLLLRLSAPSIASAVTISLYHLADTFWLGQLSYKAIAAVTVTFPFYIAVISIGVGTGVGANALHHGVSVKETSRRPTRWPARSFH